MAGGRPIAKAASGHPGVAAATDATLRASRALVGVAARSLATIEGAITLVQYRALVVLATQGPMNVGSLADALGIHASTATRLCDRLREKNLIDRATSGRNRREVLVELTDEGRVLLRAVNTRRRTEVARIVERLDAAQRAQVVGAFEAFADAAGEAPDSAWMLGWTS